MRHCYCMHIAARVCMLLVQLMCTSCSSGVLDLQEERWAAQEALQKARGPPTSFSCCCNIRLQDQVVPGREGFGRSRSRHDTEYIELRTWYLDSKGGRFRTLRNGNRLQSAYLTYNISHP